MARKRQWPRYNESEQAIRALSIRRGGGISVARARRERIGGRRRAHCIKRGHADQTPALRGITRRARHLIGRGRSASGAGVRGAVVVACGSISSRAEKADKPTPASQQAS